MNLTSHVGCKDGKTPSGVAKANTAGSGSEGSLPQGDGLGTLPGYYQFSGIGDYVFYSTIKII